MKIGLSYDLKEHVFLGQGQPEDALEEYDSLETVDAITEALQARGHSVVRLGGGREFLVKVLWEDVDLVFNIAEGRGNHRSREAQVPAILEMLDIAYSGSDPQCLAMCLDKPLTKRILAASGIQTPRWQVITGRGNLEETLWGDFPFPAFVKPAYEGSSKGIRLSSRVEDVDQLRETASAMLEQYGQPVMVEEFIAGDEVTVGIAGNRPPSIVGIMRILPKKKGTSFVYSVEVKRDWRRLVEYECPARLGLDVLQEITDSSLKIFEVLGCRDFARLDFRLSPQGVPYFLEINPLPGLNPFSSDLAIMADRVGWTYGDLISAVLDSALQRYPRRVRA